MSDAIVRILPLKALMAAISRAEYEMLRRPTRVVACRTQIRRWMTDAGLPLEAILRPKLDGLSLMGIPVVEGPDAQPELIWSVPVTGE